MHMEFYLGIDGGGTKTKVTVIDQQQNVIFVGESGPSSIDTVTNQETFFAIQKALKPFYEKHLDPIFTSVFAGIGGIVFDNDSKQVEKLLKDLKGVTNQTTVIAKNDMENALYSGNCFDGGMTLICGTGMVAFGKDSTGNEHKCGGWSYKEGDAGSGYALGFDAIHYVIRAFDGRYEIDDFAKEIAKQISMTKPTDIMDVMNRYYDQRTKIAQLAPIVTKYANLNNLYAKQIVDHATNELSLAVKGVDEHLKLKNKTLVVVGSLGSAQGYFKDQLHQKIKTIDQSIQIISPTIDPSLAAAMMAYHQIQKKG